MHGRNGTQSSTDSYFLRYTPESVAEDASTLKSYSNRLAQLK